MDKIEQIVAEQLKGEDYTITEWEGFDGGQLRRLVVHVGNFYIFYQQTTGKDYFYGCEVGTINMVSGYSSNSLISIRIKGCEDNYKRDVDFVRSILPELEIMLSKVKAYRELAK